MPRRVLAETKYLRFVEDDGWSYVERPNLKGVVTIVALTDERKLLFVEQVRPPVGRPTIELPAGLAGDVDADEELAATARRELIEETGYDAGELVALPLCATSPGMTNEMVSFFLATKLRRVGDGGGVHGEEEITVHEVPLDEAPQWLRERAAAGLIVAAKAWAGLFFAVEHVRG
jgi:ADP-ribose pyrophosphatase